jgi:hypothetical protein
MNRRMTIAAFALLGAASFAVAPASAQSTSSSAIPQQAEAPPVSGVAPTPSAFTKVAPAGLTKTNAASGEVSKGLLTPEKK